jgi:hypothetical protein
MNMMVTYTYSCIPNDGISFHETGRQIISFQSINRWDPAPWRSRYATLAYSDDGNKFIRVPNLAWWNNEQNTDPYQVISLPFSSIPLFIRDYSIDVEHATR